MKNTDLLTFTDVLKLIIPFLFALVLIWAKDFYEKWQERKNKNTHLWNSIKEGFENCIKGIEALDITLENLNKNSPVFFSFDIPSTLTDYSKRLSELENKNSHSYSDYVSHAEILRNSHKKLQAMLSQAAFHDLKEKGTGKRIKKAIKSQANAYKGDLIVFAEVELKLMKTIRSKYRKNKEHEINRLEQILKDAKNLKDKSTQN